MSDDLSPVEQFKQATSATLRSIAERDDIDVTFSNEPSGITGTRARVPFPSRDLPPDEYRTVLVGASLPLAIAAMLAESDVGASRDGLFDDSRQLSRLIGRGTAPLADMVKAALR